MHPSPVELGKSVRPVDDFVVDRPCPSKATPSSGKGKMAADIARFFSQTQNEGQK
jgi:hypothetical protein